MTQIATVRRVLGNGRVEIAVRRQSACGHDCENCAGCGAEGGVIRTVAYDTIGVTEGDKVLVFSESRGVLGAAAMVYLLPLVFFFLGYALASPLSSAFLRLTITVVCTAVGILPAVVLDRRGKPVRFTIQQKL